MACLIELHAHTSSSSPCSRMSTGELIEAAILAGLDGVAITEHLVSTVKQGSYRAVNRKRQMI